MGKELNANGLRLQRGRWEAKERKPNTNGLCLLKGQAGTMEYEPNASGFCLLKGQVISGFRARAFFTKKIAVSRVFVRSLHVCRQVLFDKQAVPA